MKTILILLISLITLSTQAQDQETKPSKKEATQTLTVSIPMMGMISIQDCSAETAKKLEPIQVKSKSNGTVSKAAIAAVHSTALKTAE